MSNQSENAFEIVYECENCGAEWSEEYPARTVIRTGDQVASYSKDCNELGTSHCDCCNAVRCPVCELLNHVAVAERSPLGGDADGE